MGATTSARGRKQTAYQILVASSRDLLDADRGDLWDSGRVNSAESVNIVYGGVPSDEHNRWSAWSNPANWRMGLFAADWAAQWIGSAEMESQSVGGKKVNNVMADPWFRKTFNMSDIPQDAVIYVASIGYHELYVNGRKVGVFRPISRRIDRLFRWHWFRLRSHYLPERNYELFRIIPGRPMQVPIPC